MDADQRGGPDAALRSGAAADLADLQDQAARLAGEVVATALGRGATIAVAESLTGGLLAGTLAGVPGVSQVLRGGVVAYATDLKATLLGVDELLLERGGAVQAEVALAMAEGVAARLGAGFGVATTGVAGPDRQDGHPPGTVYVAVHSPHPARGGRVVDRVGPDRLGGDRARVRWASVLIGLELLTEELAASP